MVLISVIVPSYNNFTSLLRALFSIESQTGNNIFFYEIIIIDDASTDSKYHRYTFDRNIQIIHLDQHVGSLIKLCQIGMKYATGDYIAFLSDEEVWSMYKMDDQMYDMIAEDRTVLYGTSISDLVLKRGYPFPL